MAEAVVFAMLASYLLSRTLVPTLVMFMLNAKQGDREGSRNPFVRFHRAFERGFERLRDAYHSVLTALVHRRALFFPSFLLASAAAFPLLPCPAHDLFPRPHHRPLLL